MSTASPAGHSASSPPAEGSQAGVRPSGFSLRALVAGAAVIAFWTYMFAVPHIEMAMFTRFISRMAVDAALLLLCVGLWLTNRDFRFRDRVFVLLFSILMLMAASRVTDKTVNAFSLLLVGMPWIMTGGALWLWASRRQPAARRRLGLYVLPCLAFGILTLVRWEGLDGAQQSEFAFRWTPTAEERFLSTTAAAPKSELTFAAASDALEWQPQPGDWPSFRGPSCEGELSGLPRQDWSAGPPDAAWKHRIGPGWSSMIVVDGRLVTQDQRGESEAVVCYDATTGKELWVHLEPGRFEEALAGAGPRATPTFHEGRIYAVGAQGRLMCLSAADGKLLWSHNIIEDAGAELPQWGLSGSPLLVDDLVVVFAGGGPKSLLAYRADTGEPAWTCEGGKFSYSTPHVLTIEGVRQVVMQDTGGLYGVQPGDGKLLWRKKNSNEMAQPMLQPHLVGTNDLVVSQEHGIARLTLGREGDDWTVSEKWATNRLKPSYNDFFIHKGHIYGLDDGILCCLDLETGNRLWKKGRYGFGQLLLLPEHDQLLVLSEKGEMVLVATNPKELEELGRFEAIAGKTWNHPVVAHGRLFVRNGEEMGCFVLNP